MQGGKETDWAINNATERAPPAHPKIAEENDETRKIKHRNVRNGLDFLRNAVKQSSPDAIILISDDQNENFVETNLPQIAIYLGDTVVTTEPGKNGQRERGPTYRCHARLAKSYCIDWSNKISMWRLAHPFHAMS